jgi:hypothetical protein
MDRSVQGIECVGVVLKDFSSFRGVEEWMWPENGVAKVAEKGKELTPPRSFSHVYRKKNKRELPTRFTIGES